MGARQQMVAVRSNFSEDIRTQVVAWFANAGIVLPEPSNLERVLFAFFSVKRRLIAPLPRDVKWSKELVGRPLGDTQRTAIATIEQEVRQGVALTPRLSKTIVNPEFDDGLLDDWGIHHLHLSNQIDASGFVKRDGSLLFVLVRPNAMYFIDLLDHGVFADDHLLQVVHDNWPEVISLCRASWIAPSRGMQPTPDERRRARKRLTVGWQAADGTVYMPPGGGTSTAGLSPRVVEAAERLRDEAIETEKWLHQNAVTIRDQISKQTGMHLEELHARLILQQPLSVLETQSNALIERPSRATVQP